MADVEEKTPLVAQQQTEDQQDKKSLGLADCVSMVMSMAIGIGIFIFPNQVVVQTNSGGLALILWACAGVVALLGSFCYTELASRIPGNGGEFIYLKEIYGDKTANTFLLVCAFIKYPAVTAIVAQASVAYLTGAITSTSLAPMHVTLVAMVMILVVCVVVGVSTRAVSILIRILNTFKIIGLVAIIAFGVYSVTTATPDHRRDIMMPRLNFHNSTTDVRLVAYGFFGCVSSYDGWNTLSMVAGEVMNYRRNLPLGNTIALTGTTALYVAASTSYLIVLPEHLMKTSAAVASDLGKFAAGRVGEMFMVWCVESSAVATVTALAICNSRLLARAALHNQIPSVFSLSHRTLATPVFSVALHLVISMAYCFITSIQVIVTVLVIVSWWFYLLCFVGILLLRKRGTPSSTKFQIPILIPGFLAVFSLALILSPLTIPGETRVSFAVSVGLLVGLYGVSILTANGGALPGWAVMSRASHALTARVEQRCNVLRTESV